VTVESK